jgi:hypothetical protein
VQPRRDDLGSRFRAGDGGEVAERADRRPAAGVLD